MTILTAIIGLTFAIDGASQITLALTVPTDFAVDSRGFGREIEFLADPTAGHWSQ